MMIAPTNTLATWALCYAAAGYRVLPLVPGGHTPLTEHGYKDASSDPSTIRAWWAEHPDANIGLVPPEGVFVLDVDPRNGGKESFASLPSLPGTWTVRTGSGGLHLYMRGTAPKTVSALAPGLDTINCRGYVVAAPSKRRDHTSQYDIVHVAPIADAPAWLLERLQPKDSPTEIGDVVPLDLTTPEGRRSALAAMDWLSVAPPAVQGQSGDTQLFVTIQVLVRKHRLPDHAVKILIEERYNPRCEPPWSPDELHLRMAHKIGEARRRGWVKEGWFPSDNFVGTLVEEAKPQALKGHVEKPSRRRTKAKGYTHDVTASPKTERTKRPMADLISALCAHPDWEGVLQYDEFKQRLLAVDPPVRMSMENGVLTREDVVSVRTWFDAHGMSVGQEDCELAIRTAARRQAFHPIRDYLDGLPACADESILDTLAARAFGDHRPIAATYVRKALIGAVRRILEPGCKLDTVLVLHGKQGRKKSQSIEVLFGRDHTTAERLNLENRDGAMSLRGFWAVEFAELSTLLRTDQETIKDFVSRPIDNYRQFRGEDMVVQPRQCVFIGTTNEDEILRDSTGDRRYQIVKVEEADLDYLRLHRDEIWSAALSAARRGENHWLTDAEDLVREKENVDFSLGDEWEKPILDFSTGKEFVSISDIFVKKICQNDISAISKLDQKVRNRISNILRRFGFIPSRPRDGSQRLRVWLVPPTMINKNA